MELKQSCRCQREYCGYLVLWRMPKRVQHSSTSFVVRSGELPDRQLKQMSCHTAQLGTVHNQCNSGQQLYTWLRSRLRYCPYSLIHIRFSLSLSVALFSVSRLLAAVVIVVAFIIITFSNWRQQLLRLWLGWAEQLLLLQPFQSIRAGRKEEAWKA